MNDRELFLETLTRIAIQNNLDLEWPYGDGYFELKKNGNTLGGFNYSGYNFGYNIMRLGRLLDRTDLFR